jgi:hypothetical protein
LGEAFDTRPELVTQTRVSQEELHVVVRRRAAVIGESVSHGQLRDVCSSVSATAGAAGAFAAFGFRGVGAAGAVGTTPPAFAARFRIRVSYAFFPAATQSIDLRQGAEYVGATGGGGISAASTCLRTARNVVAFFGGLTFSELWSFFISFGRRFAFGDTFGFVVAFLLITTPW